jgi:aspartyl-tRNA(Asn)/glutamyl-tRNA(Gln) amidotransferase subunit A
MDWMIAPNLLSVDEAISLIHAKVLSPAELIDACYRQIGRLNPRLNAFITVIPPGTDDSPPGRRSGTDRAAAELAGIPVAVKDLFETAQVRTTAGSLFFKDNIPSEDAAVVQKIRDAGGTIIGKTNTHEIALGITTINPHFGPCRNPWDEERIPGGSSGGSAVAVSTGMVLAAVGTDTGGSIRIPASLCGVVGLKPTFGRVSLRGALPLSWNLDHAGPLTRTVKDAALMLQVMAGHDGRDPYSSDVPVEDYSARIEDGIRSWRIGQGIGDYVDHAEPGVLEAVREAAAVFQRLGADVRPVDLSFLREAAVANGLMTQADGAAYHQQRLAEHPDWFGEDVRRRLEAGRDLASADYVMARRTQTQTRHRLSRLFEDYDVLLLPATPITAPAILDGDAVDEARRLTRFTAPFNLAGVPAISIPCGFSGEGLPIGLQLVAAAWNEASLLRVARAYERDTDWATRYPPLA